MSSECQQIYKHPSIPTPEGPPGPWGMSTSAQSGRNEQGSGVQCWGRGGAVPRFPEKEGSWVGSIPKIISQLLLVPIPSRDCILLDEFRPTAG